LQVMKFLKVVIVCNLQYMGSVLWNPWFAPLVVTFAILRPLVYKLAVVECIMLFTSFQIFQKSWSTWAPMLIQLQTTSVNNPSKRWRTWVQTRYVTCQLIPLWLLLCLQARHFFLVICSTKMDKVMWNFSKVKN
jgi:hypothetical protein